MSAYLYLWDPRDKRWLFHNMHSTGEAAKEKGRELWRAGAAGVKVVDEVVLVEERRDTP